MTLCFNGFVIVCSNNGFLALPGKPVGVTFFGDEDLDEATFWDLLQFKSIRDTYQ